MSFKVMVENISAQNINKYESFNPRYITLATPVKEEKNDTVEISDENNVKPDKKNRKIAKVSLIVAGAITLLGVLTRARGLNKKAREILAKRMPKHGGDKVLNFTKLKDNVQLSAKEGLIFKIRNFLNNTANIKDCYILPFLNKIPFLRGFAQKTSKIYTDTGVSMTQAAYRHANNLYGNLDKLLQENSSEEVLTLIQKRNEIINKYFTPNAIPKRAKEIEGIMDNVGDRGICIAVRDKFTDLIKKAFKNKDIKGFGEFVAEDMVRTQKSNYIRNLGTIRDEISRLDDAIMDGLKNTLDSETLEKINKTRANAQKSLNSAIRTEGNDLFDKIRDVKIGSAPNDILGMIGTTGMLGVYLTQAEDKNQRVEAALTTGVPLGLGMLSTTFATMKMYTGMKALAFGAITTFIANTIGKAINKEYQKRHHIENQKVDIPTIDNTVTDIKEKIKIAP